MVLLMGLERMGVVVNFCWVPAHVGVEGNEKADVIAKSAVRQERVIIQVPLGRRDVKALFGAKGLNLRQREWDDSSKGRQFYIMHRSVKEEVGSMGCGREEVVWSRLQFGQI